MSLDAASNGNSCGFAAEAQLRAIQRVGRLPVKGRYVKGRNLEVPGGGAGGCDCWNNVLVSYKDRCCLLRRRRWSYTNRELQDEGIAGKDSSDFVDEGLV